MPYYVRKATVTREFLEVVHTSQEKKFDKYIEIDGRKVFPPYGIQLKPDHVVSEPFRDANEVEVAMIELLKREMEGDR